ncbi:MAG: hypothetical protein RL244_210 [Pseudomonadota bacterium]
MRFLSVNLDALLVELPDLAHTQALLAALRADPVPGIIDLVPAARTILVCFEPWRTDFAQLTQAIAQRELGVHAADAGRLIDIPVHYDGEDLDDIAALLGISRAEVVRRHAASTWSVAFVGFAPGFAYLTGGDPVFDVPRRSTPRTRIPAGAVALAGTFSAVYPNATPGGWQIIGTTPTPMWDLSRPQPALLQPGDRVRFVDLDAAPARVPGYAAEVAPVPAHAAAANNAAGTGARTEACQMATPSMASALRVIASGLLTTFQDPGRKGQTGQGVSASGAMDQGALKAANRLAGNAPDAAALETTAGGLVLQSQGDTVVAVTGAQAPLHVKAADGHGWNVPLHQAIALADGDRLHVGAPTTGLRNYVAVRGGFVLEPVLGSYATDTLAHVGPAPLQPGMVLPVRTAPAAAVIAIEDALGTALPATGDEVVLDVVLGPRTDWFTPEALELLQQQRWQVTPQSNRVGLRLHGEVPLARRLTQELASEGTPAGALQVPASGQPVLFLADHPLTGGYPVIGCVAPYHLDLAGQVPVGAWLRFRVVRAFEAVELPAPVSIESCKAQP